MTSPFEQVSESIADGLRSLTIPAQVALYASAAQALAPAYRAWSRRTGSPSNGGLLTQAIEQAIGFATSGAPIEAALLAMVEANTPEDPSDSEFFTVAQDCWILVDTSLRVGAKEYEASNSAWYLLEPMFQATSERIFGASDPGSVAQESVEARALQDAQLSSAVGTLQGAIEALRDNRPTQELVASLSSKLAVLSP